MLWAMTCPGCSSGVAHIAGQPAQLVHAPPAGYHGGFQRKDQFAAKSNPWSAKPKPTTAVSNPWSAKRAPIKRITMDDVAPRAQTAEQVGRAVARPRSPVGSASHASPVSGVYSIAAQHKDGFDAKSPSPVEHIVKKISGCCAASTDALRVAVGHAGAPSLAAVADRTTLIQAMGLPAASHLGGQSPSAVAAAAGVSQADIVAAGLHFPDPLLIRPALGEAFARIPAPGVPVVPGTSDPGTALTAWISMRSADGPPPLSGTAPSGANPPPVDFRPGNWNLEKCEYTIAPGDTMYGLSKTYLGGLGSRWKEIWSLQPWRYDKCPDPACTVSPGPKQGQPTPMPGDVLIMPTEACERARAWAKSGEKPAAPATPGAPAYDNPNNPDPARPGGSKPGGGGGGGSPKSSTSGGLSKNQKIGIGVAVGVAVLGGLAFA
jgi:LysM domain